MNGWEMLFIEKSEKLPTDIFRRESVGNIQFSNGHITATIIRGKSVSISRRLPDDLSVPTDFVGNQSENRTVT